MRPLFHPPIENVTVEGILHALSDPVRVAIFADLTRSDSTFNCSTFLNVTNKQIPKSTLSHHFKALRDAGLIRTERHGVEMHNASRCPEIERRFPGLIAAILNAHKLQMDSAQGASKKRAAGKRK
jgi:DNA-binding transcriptional ArsR family regulator